MKAGTKFGSFGKTLLTSSFLVLMLVVTGCPDARFASYESTVRPPTTAVDVFKDTERPQRQYKVVGELSWKGPRSDELRAENYFIKQAKKAGGNALLIEAPAGGVYKGPRMHSPDGIVWDVPDNNAWLFKAKVLVYE